MKPAVHGFKDQLYCLLLQFMCGEACPVGCPVKVLLNHLDIGLKQAAICVHAFLHARPDSVTMQADLQLIQRVQGDNDVRLSCAAADEDLTETLRCSREHMLDPSGRHMPHD